MYTRKLNQDEQSVLNRLVELCCEAYWQEAERCRICFDKDRLLFSAHINSNWNLLETENLSLEDYATIVRTLQGIFETNEPTTINNRIVTVTLDPHAQRPIMNVRVNFNGEQTDPARQVVDMVIEDLVEEATSVEDVPLLDSDYIN
ncbi:MAG: hypothetical protein AB1489_19410 [Acidobacteriota bacterium]